VTTPPFALALALSMFLPVQMGQRLAATPTTIARSTHVQSVLWMSLSVPVARQWEEILPTTVHSSLVQLNATWMYLFAQMAQNLFVRVQTVSFLPAQHLVPKMPNNAPTAALWAAIQTTTAAFTPVHQLPAPWMFWCALMEPNLYDSLQTVSSLLVQLPAHRIHLYAQMALHFPGSHQTVSSLPAQEFVLKMPENALTAALWAAIQATAVASTPAPQLFAPWMLWCALMALHFPGSHQTVSSLLVQWLSAHRMHWYAQMALHFPDSHQTVSSLLVHQLPAPWMCWCALMEPNFTDSHQTVSFLIA